ncbi:hypothetical protein HY345_00675 [Candidatus Microgenomates bacterium]|nr:hypothetical protein [Candidatus Microgenomates bacterium]
MKKITILLHLAVLSLLTIILPQPIYAVVFCPTSEPKNFFCIEMFYANFLTLLLPGSSIAFFVVILTGGFKWLTSGGDPKAIEGARSRITFGVMGLALIIGAWFIIKFLRDFTGIPGLSIFTVPR